MTSTITGCYYLNALLGSFHRHADRTAVIHPGGELTYAELLDEVYRTAHALADNGLRRGDGVAVIGSNTPGILAVSLAAQLLGCYFVGLSSNASAAEQRRMLEFTEVSALVYEPALAGDRAVQLTGAHRILSLGPGPAGTDLLAGERRTTPFFPLAEENDVADLVFTGGSTGGKPKAAAYTFERLGELARTWLAIGREESADAAAYRADDCRLLRCFAAVDAPGVAVLPALLHGAALVLHNGFDAGAVLRSIEEQRITAMTMYPSQLYQLLDHPDVDEADLTSLRLVVYYGAPISPSRLRQAIEVFGPVLYQVYGQSETRMMCVLQPEEHRDELLRSAGWPVPGVELEIRDREIHVRSPFQMSHYWREPELTAATIVDGWVRTADLGYRDADGYVHVFDRKRNVIVVGGFNCYSVDIENVLTSHPAVCEAVVVGVDDPHTGEVVHAAVVLRAGAQVSEAELAELVRDELGELEWPRSVLFLDEIPVTRSGKPDKNVVRDLVARRFSRTA